MGASKRATLGIGHVEELRGDADFHWLTVGFPSHLAPFLVHKGSVAVDGISLTLAELTADSFSVALIPHTLGVTTLGFKGPGDAVNLETDLLAKYVWKCVQISCDAGR